jgi:hypothetical protein
MDYKKIYESIIQRASVRQLDVYTERHHIIPKCMGGTNDKNNLVDLTAREHFISHLLLVEIYPNEPKLVYAIWMMANVKSTPNYTRDYKVSSRLYETLKKLKSSVGQPEETKQKISDSLLGRMPNKGSFSKGDIPWNKGVVCDNETKKKISESNKKSCIANETSFKEGHTPWNKGTKYTEERRKEMSLVNKGKPWTQARRDAQNKRKLKSAKQ